METRAGIRPSSGPSGVSHVAVVTADLDGFRAFYEDTIGLETTIVVGAGPGHARQAVVYAGDAMLHVFEVLGYDTAAHCVAPVMFERGRLDHFGFTVADEAALIALRDRLVAVGASSGDIRRLGPMLSIRFHDPEGFEGEVNCLDLAFDPSAVRDEDEIVDPNWFARIAAVLRADPAARNSHATSTRLHQDTPRRPPTRPGPQTAESSPLTQQGEE